MFLPFNDSVLLQARQSSFGPLNEGGRLSVEKFTEIEDGEVLPNGSAGGLS